MTVKKITPTTAFGRDYKRYLRSGQYNLAELNKVVDLLAKGVLLPAKYHDHALTGKWHGYRECHIRPNWLLIYHLQKIELGVVRLGSHSELFG